ncbi:hypothetical protein ACHAWF_003757 [Thalassiosira exigua]
MGRSRRCKGGKKKRGKPPKISGRARPETRPELRFQVGDRVECRVGVGGVFNRYLNNPLYPAKFITATVLKHWYPYPKDSAEYGSDAVVPYLVLLDNGDIARVPEDTDFFASASPSPGLAIEHAPGERVEVRLWGSDGLDWCLGHVLRSNKNWAKENDCPYVVRFDHCDEYPVWCPPGHIRGAKLRFKMKDRVECIYEGTWCLGTVVRVCVGSNYFHEGGTAPYLVRTDNGIQVGVRFDTDECIKISNAPPPVVEFAAGACVEVNLKNEKEEWCQCTVEQANEDWAEYDRPPYVLRFQNGESIRLWGANSIRASSISAGPANLHPLALCNRLDDDLFATPPPRSDCPICLIPLPIDEYECYYQPCCGKQICNGCDFSLSVREELKSSCPFCRTPVPDSREEILNLCRRRVGFGDAEFIFYMGCCHQHGYHGLPKGEEKALELFLRAAELGSVRACLEISRRDSTKTRHYLEKATKLGSARARYNLGCVENDEGNDIQVLNHWKIAAAIGFKDALEAVLVCYNRGLLSKEEYEGILRSSQKAKEEEWSKEREMVRLYRDSTHNH